MAETTGGKLSKKGKQWEKPLKGELTTDFWAISGTFDPSDTQFNKQ